MHLYFPVSLGKRTNMMRCGLHRIYSYFHTVAELVVNIPVWLMRGTPEAAAYV